MSLARKGRRIGCDYGDVRIGLAISDVDGILASPFATLLTNSPDLWPQFQSIVEEYSPIEIYVGRPIHLAGHDSDSTRKAADFAQQISERFEVKVSMVDERLSTVSAQRQLKESGVSSRNSKEFIDQFSAVAILELALEIEKALQGSNLGK